MGLITKILSVVIVIIIAYVIMRFAYPDSLQLKNVKSGTITTSISESTLPNNGESVNYAYSIWFYVKNWQYRLSESKVMLVRSNSPKITLTPYSNNIEIDISVNAASESLPGTNAVCGINNIPLQKWTNLILSLNGRTADVYLDGKLVRTCILPAVPNKPTGDVNITPGGGFSGWTSNFQYWPNALNPQEAYNVYKNGPGSVSGFGKILNNHKVRVSYLVDNTEKGSFEI